MASASAKELFSAALEQPPAEREAFLLKACGDDADLRARVEQLLGAHARGEGFLSSPVADATAAGGGVLGEGPGSVIGRYKLLERIGEGGFGVVFMAEQREPVTRKVALKVVKLGMDTRQVIARFEAERQALALMDHPNIARVLDAGATGSGRPFFVMELVRGESITAYCDRNTLGPRERLELFIQVCNAVQHAHTKGIIHRDLKPSNVLVTMIDARPVPKVIDFGVAKATSARLTERTLFTEFRQLVGTPEYMSPEQAAHSGVDIDTRSDVYSLGVLLYELLTGAPPFDAKRLRSAAWDEMLRIIREEEACKPSTRLSGMRDGVASVAASRHTDPADLARLLRGDLDWIVMKCLEKERARRYETAHGLAADLQRHLAGEPVSVAPPRISYRVLKFARKHRVGVAAGLLVGAAVLIGLAGTTSAMVWALREQAAAARSARQAELDRVDAQRQRDRAELIIRFLNDAFGSVRSYVAGGRDTALLREVADTAGRRIESGELAHAPEAEVSLRVTLGRMYTDMAVYDRAEAMLTPALALARKTYPPDHEDLIAVLRASMGLHVATGDLTAFRAKMAEVRRLNGSAEAPLEHTVPDSQDPQLEERYRKELAEARRSSSAEALLLPLETLAVHLWTKGEHAEAAAFHDELLTTARACYPTPHPYLISWLHQGARLRVLTADYPAAERLLREALEMNQQLWPGDHPSTALALFELGAVATAAGDSASALAHHERALGMRRRLYSGDHRDTAQSLVACAESFLSTGRPVDALSLATEALVMARRAWPTEQTIQQNADRVKTLAREALGRSPQHP